MIGPIHDFSPWRVPSHIWEQWDAIPDRDPHPPRYRRPLIRWLDAPAAGEGEEPTPR
jgi:hypothetical protein